MFNNQARCVSLIGNLLSSEIRNLYCYCAHYSSFTFCFSSAGNITHFDNESSTLHTTLFIYKMMVMQDMNMLTSKERELIEIAKEHAKKCYQSGRTSIAAALRVKNGKAYTGINLKYREAQKEILGLPPPTLFR